MYAPFRLKRQHLIDPEICIRCNTCEATCPVGAVTHSHVNYVVDPDKCNFCMDCIAPCPTGSIDNWRTIRTPYSLDEQLAWTELPADAELGDKTAATVEAVEDEVDALLALAHSGNKGRAVAPASASKPAVNAFTRAEPAIATVQGNFRITAPGATSDVAISCSGSEPPFSPCSKASRSASCRLECAPTAGRTTSASTPLPRRVMARSATPTT
jgi:benzoyl-CoA 2,3-dioxygenase component A